MMKMQEALPRFEDVLEEVQSYKPDCDEALLRRAYVFSAMAHKGQLRISGEPYLVHPIEVARTLAAMRLDEVAIATGLLHDLLEDTHVSAVELEAQFGERIAGIVKALTKITTMEQSFAARQRAQADTFRRMLLASIEDVRVILVKLADRLHNMRTLQHLPAPSRRRIATETLEIYAPIAHRLGIGDIKAELEDLAFAQLHPEEFQRLSVELTQREGAAATAIEEIRVTISKALDEHSIDAEVRWRIKHLYSIWSKLQRQGIGLDRVYDFLAFRIVVETVPHCYAALGLIHQLWRPVPGRIKDYIAMPKANGYRSLHTSVLGPTGNPFEVQIRTREMDQIAATGIAAHWLYKEGRDDGQDAERVAWLRGLLDGQQEDPREFLDSLKLNLYPDEVYTLTPKGEVLAFPRGATPIDFAYRVHTEVGHHCAGARVNGKLVPLRTPLKNGDIVEIITSGNRTPSLDWLEHTATARARNKIRAFVNRAEKEQVVEGGRRLLEREARRLGLPLRQLREGERLAALLAEHGLSREDDLYAAVGYGRLSPRDLLAPLHQPEEAAPQKVTRAVAAVGDESTIVVKGHNDFLTYRGNCCNPLPGDEIVGYVTRGKGVAVHRADCPNVRRLLLSLERQVEVEWGSRTGAYAVAVHIGFEDRPAMLTAVSQAVSALGANIRSCHLHTDQDQLGTVDLVVEVGDRSQVDKVLSSLRQIPGVISAGTAAAPAVRPGRAATKLSVQ